MLNSFFFVLNSILSIQIDQHQWSVPAIIIGIQRLRHSSIHFHHISRCKSTALRIILPCLGKVCPPDIVIPVPRVSKWLLLSLLVIRALDPALFQFPIKVISKFIIALSQIILNSIAFLPALCSLFSLISADSQGASKLILKIVMHSGFSIFHDHRVSVIVESLDISFSSTPHRLWYGRSGPEGSGLSEFIYGNSSMYTIIFP